MNHVRSLRPALFCSSIALLLGACGQQTAPSGQRKVSAQGDLASIRTYPSTAFSDVAIDAGGNAIVAGNTSRDAVVAKYSADGTALWSEVVNSGYDPVGHAVALDANEDIYALADAWQQAYMGRGVLAKLDSAGTGLWSVSYGQNYGGGDAARFLAVDAAGHALVNTYQDFTLDPGFSLDRYTPAGRLAWHKSGQAEGPLAATPDGKLFQAYGSGTISLRKSTPSGSVIGTKTWSGGQALRVVTSRYGSVYTLSVGASGARLNKYDPNSVWQWSVPVVARPVDLTIDPAGNLYLLGTDAQDKVAVVKYTPERGAPVWTKTFDDGDLSPTGVAVGAQGQVLVVGGLSFPSMDPDPAHVNVGYIARLR